MGTDEDGSSVTRDDETHCLYSDLCKRRSEKMSIESDVINTVVAGDHDRH